MSEFFDDGDGGLFDVKASSTKKDPAHHNSKDKRAIDALRKRGLADVDAEEELCRLVYYAANLPMGPDADAKKIRDVFDAHKRDSDFLTSASMTSDLSKAKQVLFNFIASNKGAELRSKFAEDDKWDDNFLTQELCWQREGDDDASRIVVLAATVIEPDKTTEVCTKNNRDLLYFL